MNVSVRNAITGTTGVKIADSIERAIEDGELAPGEQLPTVRSLAEELRVSPTTVSSAYRRLHVRGLVMADGRRGTRVYPRPPVRFRPPLTAPEGVRDLASGNPDPELLPPLGRALARLDPSPILYGADIHDAELIQLARARLEEDGIPAHSIAVVGGALDGVERVLREHLRPGDRVAVEDPGFSGIFDVVRGMALELAPVPVDESGLVPEELARALEGGARAIVDTPRAHNPTGAVLTAERVRELNAVLASHPEVLIIEDDHAGPVSGVPAVSLVQEDRGRWAVIRSVAKSLGPDLRVAVVAGDAKTIAAVEGRQMVSLRWVSHLLQRVVVELWSDRQTQKLLARAADTYSIRRNALLEALAENGIPAMGRSGLNVWIPLEEETKIAQNLLSKGWLVESGERFRVHSGTGIRVTVAALEPEDATVFADVLSTYLRQGVRSSNA